MKQFCMMALAGLWWLVAKKFQKDMLSMVR